MKHETREIGGVKVTVQQYGARRNLKLVRRLGSIIAPALSKAPSKMDADLDFEQVAPALEALFDSLDDAELDALLLSVLSCTQVVHENNIVTLDNLAMIDRVFGADLTLMLKVVWFALEVNLGDFTGGALGKSTGALGKILGTAAASRSI